MEIQKEQEPLLATASLPEVITLPTTVNEQIENMLKISEEPSLKTSVKMSDPLILKSILNQKDIKLVFSINNNALFAIKNKSLIFVKDGEKKEWTTKSLLQTIEKRIEVDLKKTKEKPQLHQKDEDPKQKIKSSILFAEPNKNSEPVTSEQTEKTLLSLWGDTFHITRINGKLDFSVYPLSLNEIFERLSETEETKTESTNTPLPFSK